MPVTVNLDDDVPVVDAVAPKKRTPTDKKLLASLAGTYQFVGVALTGVGVRLEDQGLALTGVSIVNQAEATSEAWLDLADQNPKVKVALKRFTEVSAAGVLIGMHVAMFAPLLADRGIIPEGMAAMAGYEKEHSGNGNGDHA